MNKGDGYPDIKKMPASVPWEDNPTHGTSVPVKDLAIFSQLPREILNHIASYTHKMPPSYRTYQMNPKGELIVGSREETQELVNLEYMDGTYTYSTNLNTTQFLKEHAEDPLLPRVQFWCHINWPRDPYFRIEDDGSKQFYRMEKPFDHKGDYPNKFFFDGPNYHQYFLMAFNISSSIPIGNYNRSKYITTGNTFRTQYNSFYGVDSFALESFSSESTTKTAFGADCLKKIPNEYIESVAFCKTSDRYSIATNKAIRVFGITQENSQITSRLLAKLRLSDALCKIQPDISSPLSLTIKKISFLTPNTFLMHINSCIYTGSFNKGSNVISLANQIITKGNNLKVVVEVKNIAVNPCNPHHMVVLDLEGNLFFLNFSLRGNNPQTLIRIGSGFDPDKTELWIHDNTWETPKYITRETICLAHVEDKQNSRDRCRSITKQQIICDLITPIAPPRDHLEDDSTPQTTEEQVTYDSSPPIGQPIIIRAVDKCITKDNHKDTSENDGNSTQKNSLSTSNSQIINQVKLAQLKRSLIQKKIFPLRRPILIKLNTFARINSWWPPWPTGDASSAILKNVINASLRSFESLHSDFCTNPYQRINQF